MKYTKLTTLLAGLALGAVVSTSQAQVILEDDFETGIDTSRWTGQATLFTESTTRVFAGTKSALATSSANRMSSPVNFNGATSSKLTFYFYDADISLTARKQMAGVFTWA